MCLGAHGDCDFDDDRTDFPDVNDSRLTAELRRLDNFRPLVTGERWADAGSEDLSSAGFGRGRRLNLGDAALQFIAELLQSDERLLMQANIQGFESNDDQLFDHLVFGFEEWTKSIRLQRYWSQSVKCESDKTQTAPG